MARIIEGDVYKAHLEAKRIIEEATRESMERLQESMTQAQSVEEEAVSVGFKEANNEMARDIIRIFMEREQRLLGAQTELWDLSLELAQRILGDTPRVSRQEHADLIRQAVREIADKRRLLIKGQTGTTAKASACEGIVVEEDCDIDDGRVELVCDAVKMECDASAIASLMKNSYEN